MFYRTFVLSVLGLFFIGCAPKYSIKKIYIPPVGEKYKTEIKKCRINEIKCQRSCYKKYQKCKKSSLESAKKIYAIEEKRYSKLYESYMERLDDYNYQFINWQNDYEKNYKDWQYFKNKCDKYNDKYACYRKDELRNVLTELRHNKPVKPKPPHRISFGKIVSNQEKLCQSDCGCEREYDICFLNIGGSIEIKKICVENCK